MLLAKQNRENLFAKLLPNSIVILPGNKLKYRSGDVEYPFRQDNNFYYLTKFVEPNAVAVFIKSNDNQNQFILFNQEIDPEKEIWVGSIIGQQAVLEEFGVDIAYPINQIDLILPQLLIDKEILYYPMFQNLELDHNLHKWRVAAQKIAKTQQSKAFPQMTEDLSVILYELRLIKSSIELEKIRYVTQISAKAHEHIMRYVGSNKNKGLTEQHVQAEFYNYCLQHNCNDMAYPPVVASGKNACILHYTKNSAPLKEKELLLVDAGAEYDYYAADITRVFPINGKFSAEQKDLYQLVLYAQKEAINQIKPRLLWSDLQQTIIKCLVQGLVDLKLLKGDVDELISTKAYRSFYMHGSGHFLGMDVHDPQSYKIDGQFRSLLPGMVLTVEPGLYWQGVGIRIEDDILVTQHGYEILTKAATKEIDDIEHLMKNN